MPAAKQPMPLRTLILLAKVSSQPRPAADAADCRISFRCVHGFVDGPVTEISRVHQTQGMISCPFQLRQELESATLSVAEKYTNGIKESGTSGADGGSVVASTGDGLLVTPGIMEDVGRATVTSTVTTGDKAPDSTPNASVAPGVDRASESDCGADADDIVVSAEASTLKAFGVLPGEAAADTGVVARAVDMVVTGLLVTVELSAEVRTDSAFAGPELAVSELTAMVELSAEARMDNAFAVLELAMSELTAVVELSADAKMDSAFAALELAGSELTALEMAVDVAGPAGSDKFASERRSSEPWSSR
ncbi:hypothetical protein LTR53_009019 [Teratosphaeriaceae sp. CCFEE 6253]|nr:hypothetical protein LTR53_009019 [Teratosphaeriaceae sp. CCFEE 6253]